MHVPFISIGWKVVDKLLGAGLKLFIINISLENVLHPCHYKENKNIQNIHTYIVVVVVVVHLCLSLLFVTHI